MQLTTSILPTREVEIGPVRLGGNRDLVVIAGPCVVEGESITLRIAARLKEISVRLGLPVIFKASFDKANRTSGSSFRGPGMEEGLRVLETVRRIFELPVTTDVHLHDQAAVVAQSVDLLQVPAFLCRR
jgi:2-dehydro-3-deoxyphosphooctonate aldolase (KDO 8-P synthase)